MKTLVMLVVAGGLYAADGTMISNVRKATALAKLQNKSRTVTRTYRPN